MDNKTINQADLFKNAPKPGFSRKENTEVLKEVSESKTEMIPDDYIAVKLCTLGKLSAPSVLHFRNYTLGEAAELADVSFDNQYEIFVKILDNMVYEDFDCSKLHKEEVLEILLNIYSTWWSPILETPYYINEDLTGKDLLAKENKGFARIRISGENADIEIKDLLSKFKTPFTLKGPDKKEYKLRFPIVGDLIFAKKFIDIKYAEEEKFFSKLSKLINKEEEEKIDHTEMLAYKEFLNSKMKDGLLVERSCLLLSVDGKEIIEAEERLEIAKKLPLDFWAFITKLQKDYSFGIEPEISFYTEEKKLVTRRFLFRFLDFFPSLEQESNRGYTVSFD